MKQIALYGLGKENSIFKCQERDGCWQPWVMLKGELADKGYELVTHDCLNKEAVFEVHVNAVKPVKSISALLIAIEPPQIFSKNYTERATSKYRAILTWNDELLDDERFHKLYFPNPISLASPIVDGYSNRNIFSCIIAGNKSTKTFDKDELYSERLAVISWFQENHPRDFKLFGVGWNFPPNNPGVVGKIVGKINRLRYKHSSKVFFHSYQGEVLEKKSVLSKTKFCFCYENVKGLKGYITEKIFDCFFSGCVPVYWGAENVAEYIPENCYIDRRDFNTMIDLYSYLNSMNEEDYIEMQKNISEFLLGKRAELFSSEYFSKRVAEIISWNV